MIEAIRLLPQYAFMASTEITLPLTFEFNQTFPTNISYYSLCYIYVR